MQSLPAFYYPSTIVCVDDDKLFLEAITQFFADTFTIKTFTQPEDCLAFFDSYKPPISEAQFLRECKEYEYCNTINHSPVDFNVTRLNALSQHPNRNQEISLVILDYNMPSMNGIEVAERLGNITAKKILLTGEANNRDAINAFNKNIIDRFIRKDSPTIANEILNFANTLIEAYFIQKTASLISHLEVRYPLPLTDPLFKTFFLKWCKEHSINEYRLIDKNGSFALINKNNQVSYFVVHTERSLNDFYDLHDDVSESYELLQDVKNRKKIPFFGFAKEAWQFKAEEWERYFYLPEFFGGREGYYWVWVE